MVDALLATSKAKICQLVKAGYVSEEDTAKFVLMLQKQIFSVESDMLHTVIERYECV